MSIETEINRIENARENMKSALINKNVDVPDGATLSDIPSYISQIEGTTELNLQEKTVTPTAEQIIVTPDGNYNGLSKVTVEGDVDLIASNIRKGVYIFGITGTYGSDEEKYYVTVTFDSNGGTEVASQTIEAGGTATEPTSTKTDYYLKCWKLNGEEFSFLTPIYENITLVAEWTKIYSIKFTTNDGTLNAQGGETISTDSKTITRSVVAGNTIGTPPTGEKGGYTIDGWLKVSTNETFTNTEVANLVPTRDETFTAIWSI